MATASALSTIVDERGQRRGEGHHQREVAQQRRLPDLGPSAPAILWLRGLRTAGRHATSDRERARDAHARRRAQARAAARRGDSSAATRSAPTPPASPPKAAAAATRAISGFAEWGSNRSLSSDQNAEMAIAPSTEACT